VPTGDKQPAKERWYDTNHCCVLEHVRPHVHYAFWPGSARDHGRYVRAIPGTSSGG
jgi:hypothetical protein